MPDLYSSNNENTENVQEDRTSGEILMNGRQEELPIYRLRYISIKSLAQKTMM